MVINIGEFNNNFNLFDSIDLTDALGSIMDTAGLKKANVFF